METATVFLAFAGVVLIVGVGLHLLRRRSRPAASIWKGILVDLFTALVIVTLVAQVVPRSQINPTIVAEPPWDSPRTRDLAAKACFDCHSNETVWPWYANVVPLSLAIERGVTEGRAVLNFSEWQLRWPEATSAAATVADAEMPPWDYLILHPEARLSSAEKQQLIEGLEATFDG